MRFHLLIFVFLVLISQANAKDIYCGPLSITQNEDGGGPWDYNDPANQKPNAAAVQGYLKLVEEAHFTKDVERLIRGKTGAKPFGDIAYTLYRFPNHPRALWAMSRLQRRNGGKLPAKPGDSIARQHVECYFKKAILFRPHDPVVHMLYGMHLQLSGELHRAKKEYKTSERYDPNSAELLYNMGLLYLELKNYNKARIYAKKAYKLGYPLKGLKQKLNSLKH